MKLRQIPILVASLVLLAYTATAQSDAVAKKRPPARVYGLETPFEDPILVPNDIFNQLKAHERTQQCLPGEREDDKIEPSWFVAANVDLDGRGASEVIVKAENGCLLGANIGPFWIFRKTANGYELLLEDYVLGLRILESRTKGYADIEGVKATAVQVITVRLRFNGKKYIHGQPVVQDIR